MFDFYEGKLSFEEVVAVTGNVFGSTSNIEDFENSDFAKYVGQTDMLVMNAVTELQLHGMKVGLLTNNGYWSKAKKRSMIFPEANQFDVVVESCRVGYRKPQPEIYRKMLNKLNVLPTESIMVDDSPLVLEGAQLLGMSPVLVENQDTQKALDDVYKLLNGQKINDIDDIAHEGWRKSAFA
ncbi:unnamed protein product [Bursaphelenchus okinawaensis]|uniref:Uncharacterized protein n=1 Tax=Bursaphelenchus okinawaensis TaxID=465554 RepID=A0A811KTT7_9BILA|nr:unnamed protein product [Bursaphelenchus okinawaensis]CAG9113135.1 unnamed protein product [Bursaphelenchus okinawaensis]